MRSARRRPSSPAGAYAGKTVGGAGLSIFPDDDTGFAGLLQWIKLKADGGSTCGSFFHAHAPTAEDLADRLRKREGREPTEPEMTTFEAATHGNDPEAYLANVAKAMDTTADAIRNKPLKSVDPTRFGAAIKAQEGWGAGGKSLALDAGIKDPDLPAASRFRLLYTKLAGGVP